MKQLLTSKKFVNNEYVTLTLQSEGSLMAYSELGLTSHITGVRATSPEWYTPKRKFVVLLEFSIYIAVAIGPVHASFFLS